MNDPYAPPQAAADNSSDSAAVAWWSRALAVPVGGLSGFAVLGFASALFLMSQSDAPFGTLSLIAVFSGFSALCWFKGAQAFWHGTVNRWVWLFAPVALAFLGALIQFVGMMMPGG